MTPELEELVKLFASVYEAAPEDKRRSESLFLSRCGEIAGRCGSTSGAIARFAASHYLKTQASADRRPGRPPATH